MKKLLGLLVMVVAVLSLSACSSDKKDSVDKLEQIKKAGVIKIGTNSGYPPYEFYDTRDGKKELVGYDIDLGNVIAKEIGVKAEFVDMDFDALIPSLLSGKIDIILAGMVENEERKKSVDFSIPYLEDKTVIVAKKDEVNSMKSVADLKGKTIVVQTATIQAAAAENFTDVNVVKLASVGDTIAYLTSGQAQGLLIAKVSANNIIKQFPDYSYVELEGVGESSEDGGNVVVDKNQPQLLDKINEIIKGLEDKGELEKMFTENMDLYNKLNK